MFAVMETAAPAKTKVDLYFVADGSGQLDVFFHSGLWLSVPLSQGANHVSLPDTVMHTKRGYSRQGIRLVSTVNITVHLVTSGVPEVIAGALIFPVDTLSNEYIIFSSSPYPGYLSEFNIVGVYNDTTVNVAVVTNPPQNISVSLNEFTTYQFQSTIDTSNAYLTSNKPVAVFSGNTYSHVQFGAQTNYVQVPGVDMWGTEFVVPQIDGWDGYMIRIYTKHAANVRMKGGHLSGVHMAPHNSFEFIERYYNNVPITISSDVGIAVVQYGDRELGHWVGDPFMAIVPPIDQYQTEFEINIPNINEYVWHFVTVTAPRDKISGIMLDNAHMTAMDVTISNASTQFGSEYSVVTKLIPHQGLHTVQHIDGNVTMAVLVYGNCSSCSYGYPAEITFRKSDCTGTTATNEPTTVGTTTPATIELTTTTTTVEPTTTQAVTATTARVGLGCFSCNNMVHMRYCDHIEYCSPYQVCYVQRYAISGGDWRYTSGCIGTNPCQQSIAIGRRQTDGTCLECCTGSFCNSHGCGDTGLPLPSQRPPLCFHCHHLGRTDECHNVIQCAPGQVCSIQEYAWGAESYFKMGCADNQCLADGRSMCNQCCSADVCNTACIVSMGTEHIVAKRPNVCGCNWRNGTYGFCDQYPHSLIKIFTVGHSIDGIHVMLLTNCIDRHHVTRVCYLIRICSQSGHISHTHRFASQWHMWYVIVWSFHNE